LAGTWVAGNHLAGGISRWCRIGSFSFAQLAGHWPRWLEIAGLTFLLPFPFVCASALRMFLGCCWQKTHFVFWHDCHETLHGPPDSFRDRTSWGRVLGKNKWCTSSPSLPHVHLQGAIQRDNWCTSRMLGNKIGWALRGNAGELIPVHILSFRGQNLAHLERFGGSDLAPNNSLCTFGGRELLKVHMPVASWWSPGGAQKGCLLLWCKGGSVLGISVAWYREWHQAPIWSGWCTIPFGWRKYSRIFPPPFQMMPPILSAFSRPH
jgi:hypothetical protein